MWETCLINTHARLNATIWVYLSEKLINFVNYQLFRHDHNESWTKIHEIFGYSSYITDE